MIHNFIAVGSVKTAMPERIHDFMPLELLFSVNVMSAIISVVRLVQKALKDRRESLEFRARLVPQDLKVRGVQCILYQYDTNGVVVTKLTFKTKYVK